MSEAAEHWEEFLRELELELEGAGWVLFDVYVLGTNIDHWRAAAGFIAKNYRLSFSRGWVGTQFPPDLNDLFAAAPDAESTLLVIDVSGLHVHCYFLTTDEIEFDLDSREVSKPAPLNAVFEFMKGIACATGKDVILTPESAREHPIFRCRPAADMVEFTKLH